MINLVSDTVTKPTPDMLKAMMSAAVGDDVFGEDPSIRALEEKGAGLFGKEAAVFCPSGTMTNQIALKVHTRPLDEVICHSYSHIYQYEAAGYAFNSGIGVNLLEGPGGKINAAQVLAAIKPRHDWLPVSSLVVIENTCNKGGGTYYTLDEVAALSKVSRENGLAFHLDGARIFNALVETGESPADHGNLFDSVSVCLSKGLGAPVGSLLIGDRDFIAEARRFRKVMGGGMRQAGYLAAAASYALDHHVDRLKEDHEKARMLAAAVSELPFVKDVRPVQTNILIFDVENPFTAASFLAVLSEKGMKASAFGPQTVRMVTHLDVTMEEIQAACDQIRTLGA